MLGRILGNYRLQAHIGSGGMGVVYRGEHTLIGRRAAVKVLLPEYSTRKDLIRRFFNEAKAAASAQHPGIVEVYDFGQAGDGTAYLIMELLEGDTLWQRLRKAKRLEERQALVIARQIAAALAAAHQAGVIHRDLKPGNIFLLDAEEPGGVRVKLMDFGVAKLMREDSFGEGLTTTGAIVGTPTFMSPEQCRGGGTPIDWRSDLYSLGCILFAMLAGRPPFSADGSGAVLAMHIYEPAPRVKDFQPVSDEVDRLVSQLLSKRAEDRASEIRELAGILAEMAPTEEGRRRSPASAPALVPTVLDDSAATTPRATQPGEMTAPVASAAVTVPRVGAAPAFVVPASAVPALAAAVPVLRRDKPIPVAFPRPATTLKPGTTPAPGASSPQQVSSPLQGSAPLPSSPSSPSAGPLAPTLKPSTPAPPQPGGGVAVAVAITVPAAAAAPPPPRSLIPAQQARRRVETPASWPDGTPTARTTMPPRAFRRSPGPTIAIVLALTLFGGSLFAAFQMGAFGRADRDADEAAEPTRPAPQPTPSRVVEREMPAAPISKVAAPAPEPSPPAPVAEEEPPPETKPKPEPVESAAAREETPTPPPARVKKRAKRTTRDKVTPSVSASEDNVIDPFAEPRRR